MTDHTFEECTCGICMETIGYDPEIPCPDCPEHGDHTPTPTTH